MLYTWNSETDRHPVASAYVGDVELSPGHRVRLRPSARADILDTVLAGQIATIESIEQDFEDHLYLAVTLDDDPGRDLGLLRQSGHRFFFHLDEVDPLES
ncbi:MAG: hypothetical protein ABFC96_16650 [Thermoguttaceae bacterium]